jgi:sulfite dehydrogenase (quinone) subunit SoeC
LSSTLHLGHPERAWRAFSQWRSSWLSREGVLAVLTYPVALAFLAVWSGLVPWPTAVWALALLTLLFCVLTVICTAMIYRSLKTIRQWNNPLVVPVYLAFALATGATLLPAIAVWFGRWQVFQAGLAIAALIAVLVLKWLYWRSIDAAPRSLTTGMATGLGHDVRMWELPHTNTNFIQKEMGFVVARKHALKLRAIVMALLCLAALLSLLSAFVLPHLAVLAAAAALLAAVCERWLFFAEAQHVVTLYYGQSAA